MQRISLQFSNDLHRDDLAFLERAPGCLGVSAYRNTANVYFKRIRPETVLAVTILARKVGVANNGSMALLETSFDNPFSVSAVHDASREEVWS